MSYFYGQMSKLMETKTGSLTVLEKKILNLIKDSGEIKPSNLYKKIQSDLFFEIFLSNKFLLISVIQKGLPYSFFDTIQNYTPFNTEDWLSFLDISSKTLSRYKESDKLFKPYQSEKMIELTEVTHVGLDVFGHIDKFRIWLDTPNFSLGNLKPIDLLKDSYGKELVLAELTRINYGILA